MPSEHPLAVCRSPLLSADQLAAIEEAALRLLAEVGLAIADETLVARLEACGYRLQQGRLRLERRAVSGFIEAERARQRRATLPELAEGPPEPVEGGTGASTPAAASTSSATTPPPELAEGPPEPVEGGQASITLGASPYPQWVHDLESDRIVPYDTPRLIEASRLTHVLGIVGRPGCPADVAPALQPVVQYWATACASRYARDPVDPKSHEALPYVMAMAEALGRPMTSLPVYVFTPLTLGSESLRCVFAAQERLHSVAVSSMPSLGLSAPIGLGDAFSVAAAEVVGAALIVEALTGLPTRWRVAVFPADLRALMMVFGSPENHLLQLASEEVDAYLHGRAWRPYAVNMHTNAKRPGAQASAEKASQMTSGALLGARHFYPAGTLSLDEAFSAEQLIYDVEIAAHVERLVRGVDAACDPDTCLDVVREGLAARSFIGLEDTVARYRQVYWHPQLFQRGSLASWMGRGAPRERDQAAARVRELLAQHDYELEPELRRELDAILARAREQLG